MKNNGDKEPTGIRWGVTGRLRRRVSESPAMDAAKTRHEDNFGIPLDALDAPPPVGIEAYGARHERRGAHKPRKDAANIN